MGTIAVLWGIFAYRTGKTNPLTPKRTAPAPAILLVPWIVASYIRPAPVDPHGPPWTPPTFGELVINMSGTVPAGFVGGVSLVVLGVAIACRQWLSAGASVLFALLVVLNTYRVGLLYTDALSVVLFFGLPSAVVGYWHAEPRDRGR